MPLRPCRDDQRRFWRLIREGVSTADASACLGLNPGTGKSWFRQAGGMSPVELDPPERSYRLSIQDREKILAGMHRQESIRTIAASIGRAPSTVKRELERNLRDQQYRPRAEYEGGLGSRRRKDWNYSPHLAQQRADQKASRKKPALLATRDRLREEVQDRLKVHHSPEQISHRLKVDFPDDPEMRVCTETIYGSLYVQGRGALRRELTACLRTGRALRKPRRRAGQRRSRQKVLGMISISERPPEVEDRAVPGDWEGDLITGEDNGSAIGTLVERATGFTMLLHLPNDHGAVEVQEAMIAKMAELPDILRRTLTWDQGIEMANHVTIADKTGLDIYFCDPHSPWQRGSNENTNGLLRQYFPKGTDLSKYPADYLDYVALQLNTRPRKRHAWKTPAEALDELLNSASKP